MKRDDRSFMRTPSGEKFYPLNINSFVVNIEDVARSLAAKNRYNCHLKYFYSVAQHSWLVENYLCICYLEKTGQLPPAKTRLQALIHDISESVMPDTPSPIKKAVPGLREYEDKLTAHMFKTWDLDFPTSKEIEDIDKWIRFSEIACLSDWDDVDRKDPTLINIVPWQENYAYDMFMKKYQEIIDQINSQK